MVQGTVITSETISVQIAHIICPSIKDICSSAVEAPNSIPELLHRVALPFGFHPHGPVQKGTASLAQILVPLCSFPVPNFVPPRREPFDLPLVKAERDWRQLICMLGLLAKDF